MGLRKKWNVRFLIVSLGVNRVFTLFLLGSIMFEVFDPCVGTPVFRTRLQWLAGVVALVLGLDWARVGEGWL